MNTGACAGVAIRAAVTAAAMLAWAARGRAADQVWIDTNADNVWSAAAPNWDTGVVWTDGNNAIFGGTGETVDVDGAVSVGNITFNVGGYGIADLDGSGAMTLLGSPTVIRVVNTGDVAAVSENLDGWSGWNKAGLGTLVLSGTNTFSGQVVVESGTLRLSVSNTAALGATDVGSETVVNSGATLDFAGAYRASVSEDLIVSGHGVDGQGALVNTGLGQINQGFRHLTLLGDTTIGGPSRLDLNGAGVFAGNGWTLIKAGAMEMAVSRAINGVPIVINGGLYTLQHVSALGADDCDTTVNGGRLNCWGNISVSERLIFNGGGLSQGSISNTFRLTGHMTFNSNIVVVNAGERRVDFCGLIDGAGGLTNSGGGRLLLTVDTLGYEGETVNAGGTYLHIGTNDLAAGLPGPGPIVNHGHLCIDRAGTFALSNRVSGTGITYLRYGAEVVLEATIATQTSVRVGHGTLSLAAGSSLVVTNDLTLADRQGTLYRFESPQATQVVAVINIPDGCELTANAIIGGNGTNIADGAQLGTINQFGGVVRTLGATAESNGLRLAHYPQGYCVYNMMGGTLTISNGYDLGIATDGTGWVHQTGGEIHARTVMLNERAVVYGYGRLTVEGGVLNVGEGGITRDPTAPYLVEYGGSGGVVRAAASFVSPLDATLSGTGAAAITFDSAGFDIALTGVLGGGGGLNKAGAGALDLSRDNPYAGGTAVQAGTLRANNAGGSATGAGQVDVLAGGTLGGTGRVGGAVSVAAGGTLAPGMSVGDLEVGGTVTFADNSIYAVEVSGAAADLLATGGNVTLGGATLNVAAAAPSAGGYILVVATNATVSGTFQDASNNPLAEGAAVPGMPGYFVHYVTAGSNDYVVLTMSPGSDPVPRFSVMAENGQVVVRWRTAFELGTAGYDLYRKVGADWVKVNAPLIPAAGSAASGFEGQYSLADAGAAAGGSCEFKLVKSDADGGQIEYGPYTRVASEFVMTSPVRAAPGQVEVRWVSRDGEVYRLLRSTNLLETAVQVVGQGIVSTPPENVFTDGSAPAGVRFYRVELEP